MATIAEIRKQYPQYADMTDAQLADALHARYYRDIPKDQFYKRVGIGGSDFIDDMQRGAGQAISAIGSAMRDVPIEAVSNLGQRAERYGEELVAANPADVARIQDVNSLSSGLNYVGERIAETIPQIAVPLAAAGGAALAGASAPIVAGASLGAGALGSLAQEYGGIRQEQREQGIDDKARAAMFAVPAAALDVAGVGRVIPGAGRVLGDVIQTGLVGTAKTAGRIGVEEAATEAAQTALERAGAGQELASPEAINEYINAAAAGFSGGAGIGAGRAAYDTVRGQPEPAPTPEPVVAPTTPEPAQPGTPVDAAPADVPSSPVPVPSPAPADGGAGRTVEIGGREVEVDNVTPDGEGNVIVEGVNGDVLIMPVDDWQRISAPEPVAAEPTVTEPAVSEPEPTPITDQDFIRANTPTADFTKAIRGKTLPQVAGYVAENATLPSVRKVMSRAQGVLDAFEREGIKLDFGISDDSPATTASRAISRQDAATRGITSMSRRPDGSGQISVGLAGMRKTFPGVQEITAAHEIIHAVTVGSIKERAALPQNSRVRKAADGLTELRDIVGRDYARYARDSKPAINTAALQDPYELIAYGLTDKVFQDYLKTVKTKTGNAFTDFVAYVARVLGLNKSDENALMRLIELTDDLIPVAAADIADVVAANKVMFRMGDQPGGMTDIEFRQQEPGLTMPAETRTQAASRKFVDRLGRVRQAEELGTLDSRDRSAYEAARRMDSKAAARIEDFNRKYFQPIERLAKAARISVNEMDWFLYARAAEARNVRLEREQREAFVRSLPEETRDNPAALQDAIESAYADGTINESGSGISTIEAREMLRDYRERENWPSYERIGQLFDDLHRERMELAVARDLVSRETADYLMAAEPNYAPMKGRSDGNQDLGIADEDLDPTMGYGGTGIAVSVNEWRKAKGRSSLPFSPYGYAKSDAVTSIVRGERNSVGKLLAEFFTKNPSPLWRVYGARGLPRDNNGRPISVSNRTPEWFVVKMGGKPFYVNIKDPLMERAIKALDVDELRPLLNYAIPKLLAGFTRTLARSFTSWNPEFFVVNYGRDIQSAILNIMAETDLPDGRAKGKEVVKNFARYATSRDNMRAIAASEFNTERLRADPDTVELYRQFKLDGGSVGWITRENPREVVEKLRQDFNDLILSQQRFGPLTVRENRSQALKYYARRATRTGRSVVNALENTNAIFENGIRFAAYRAALDSGMSRNQAAMLAREVTVDFNRRGEANALINALYAFFNAGVQGAARTARSLSNNPIKTGKFSRAQATVLAAMGATAAIAMYNAATSAEDDDGKLFYDKIPDYEKERAIIIMSPFDGENYIKLPIPYGYGFFPAMATRIMDAIRLGEEDKLPTATLNSLLQNFSPLQFNQGSSVFPSIIKGATPTALKPMTDIMLNENFMGKPIYNKPYDSSQSLASTPRFSTPEEYVKAAQFLNDISGGEGKIKGGLNASPEAMQYIVEFLLGGVAGITRSVQRSTESENPAQSPVIRRFIGTPQESRNIGEYYERSTEAQSHAMEYRNKDTLEERLDFKRRHPVTMNPRVQSALSNARKEERALKKQRTAIQENESLDAAEKKLRLDELKARLDRAHVRFNTVYNETERASR